MAETASWDTAPERLKWRRPAWLFVSLAALLGLGAPYAALRSEGAVGAVAALAATLGFASALVSLILAGAWGHAYASRAAVLRHVLTHVTMASLVAPVAAQIVLAFFGGPISLLGPALWPMSIMLGWPYACFAGLCLALLAFTRR